MASVLLGCSFTTGYQGCSVLLTVGLELATGDIAVVLDRLL